MWRKLKRRLFESKYLLRQQNEHLERIEMGIADYKRAILEYQHYMSYLLSVAPPNKPDPKNLAYFFHLNRGASKSQLCQDLWVIWESKAKTNGFFVEFGASDGVTLSNTHLLEERYGWKGILAEPLPDWHPKLKLRKAIVDTRCVWTSSGKKLPFVCAELLELSGLAQTADQDYHAAERQNGRQIEVETISLNDLLKKHNAPKVIDYISIDTEGSEYDILCHFDFDTYQVNLLTVEHNFSKSRLQIHDLLTQKGYTRVFEDFSQWDDWYVHRRFRDLTGSMPERVPPLIG